MLTKSLCCWSHGLRLLQHTGVFLLGVVVSAARKGFGPIRYVELTGFMCAAQFGLVIVI